MAVKVLFTFYTLNAIVHSSKTSLLGTFYLKKGTIRDSQNDVLRPKPNAIDILQRDQTLK